jgi:hypothetical protein
LHNTKKLYQSHREFNGEILAKILCRYGPWSANWFARMVAPPYHNNNLDQQAHKYLLSVHIHQCRPILSRGHKDSALYNPWMKYGRWESETPLLLRTVQCSAILLRIARHLVRCTNILLCYKASRKQSCHTWLCYLRYFNPRLLPPST